MTPKKLVNAEHDIDLGSSVIIPLQYIYIYVPHLYRMVSISE